MARPSGTSASQITAALGELGFTPLEAEVYVFLVRESPATGYRIAQGVGKSVGNIYKAVEALEEKGAVMVGEDGGNRLARAVEPSELVARLERDFRVACATTLRKLGPADEAEPDDLLYRIVDRGAFFERCRRVIRGAKRFILLSACPGPLAELADELEALAARGVPVMVKTYGPAEIKGVEIVPDPRGARAVEAGPGQWIELTADGRELAQGVLDHENRELHLGQWTQNPMLNWMAYTGRYADIALAAVRTGINDGATAERLKAVLERFRPFATPASEGKMRMVARYRRPSPAGRRR
ncbi:MAG: hypothetical protein IT436_00210 [Phycisphaerales bacterium]|nr:hypothetical protein [Phycisphaerales bacterium]